MAAPPEKEPLALLGVNYKERKDSAPPGLTWRKVKTGDTLGSIASEYGVRVNDIALYNWYTINKAYINWYLHHWVGCHISAGQYYKFSDSDNPGYILVPDLPGDLARTPPKNIAAVRDGAARLDSKLQVQVVEWQQHGSFAELSGKWLYVFSGSGGRNFGYLPPPPPPIKIDLERPVSEAEQPGSAFTLDFPGAPNIERKPDKLEYEIFVTAENDASTEMVMAVSGQSGPQVPKYEAGNKWHFLSDPTILKKALKDGRHTRTSHAYRNTKTVTLDVSKDQRFYFLLSPFQLGPKALQYAMDHPQGLTPLLRQDQEKDLWNQGGAFPNTDQYIGPGLDDVKKSTLRLPVIDPYAWAESIATHSLADHFKTYSEWINSKKNATTEELKAKTSWTMEHYFVAQILKSVGDSGAKVDGELRDPARFKSDLDLWEQGLFKRNAEINAALHWSVIQLQQWLDGPAHTIIETAALQDTVDDDHQDGLDIGRAILHWALCTKLMMATEPGVVYLQDILQRSGNVPYDVVLQHFKDLDKDTLSVTVNANQKLAMRYGWMGVLMLLSLQDFVTVQPPLPEGTDRSQYLIDLAAYEKRRTANLIKLLNALEILPAQVKPLDSLTPLPKTSGWSILPTVVNAMLDFFDKLSTYIVDKNITIPRHGRILNSLANLEQWFDSKPKWYSNAFNYGTTWGLKVFAVLASGYNLYSTITTARYDYQNSVSWDSWTSTISGSTLALQDIVVEVAAWSKNAGAIRVFPSLTTTVGGPSWGVAPTAVSGSAGWVFAGVNVIAMAIAGAVTMVSMSKGFTKAKARADYTAAAFYGVGVAGGAMMLTGAVFVGLALMKVGWIFTATGAGASIGVALFLVGGILAAVAALGAWAFSSDDYQLFARKCSWGKHSGDEPRFGSDPPAWTRALKTDSDSWPIHLQRLAILNLLGRFKLKTSISGTFEAGVPYQGRITFELTPGLVLPGSRIEVALHCGVNGDPTKATVEWRKFDSGGLQNTSRKAVEVKPGPLFDANGIFAQYTYTPNSDLSAVTLYAYKVNYDGSRASLLTTVTVSSNDPANQIRCRKLVMEEGTLWGVTINNDETTSEIFE